VFGLESSQSFSGLQNDGHDDGLFGDIPQLQYPSLSLSSQDIPDADQLLYMGPSIIYT